MAKAARFTINGPVGFVLGKTSIANHAVMEAHHNNELLFELGRLRDKASGERRDALNDALRIMTRRRIKTSYPLGEYREQPVAEPRLKIVRG